MHSRLRASTFIASLSMALAVVSPVGASTDAASAVQAPMRITSATLPVGSDTLAYLKTGQGPAVVIVHGVGGHKEDWQQTMLELAASHTVYAIDMLGFGGSTRAASDYSMPAQAGAIAALLRAEGIERADIVGNSVGGWVAATFAATYPQATARLVVVDPAGFEAMFKGDPPVNLFPDDVGQMKKLLEYVIHSDFAHTDAFAEQAYRGFVASNEKSIVPALFPALLASPKLEAVMPQISAPTLVIWGKEDKLFPVQLAPYITSLTPGARTVVLEAASHFPQLDQPAQFNAVVKGFLGE